jgi:pimeloyl-ACP methyl ester carboxylesterase
MHIPVEDLRALGVATAKSCLASYQRYKTFGNLHVHVEEPWATTDPIIITFRGTASREDIRVDAKWPMRLVTPRHHSVTIGVHPGMWDNVTGKEGRELAEWLETLYPFRRFSIRGHSKGAQEGLYMALMLADRVAQVSVIACPRPGNQAFVDLYTELLGDRTTSFINDADFFTHTPPAALGWRQLHRDNLVLVGEDGRLTPKPTLWSRTWAFLWDWPCGRLLDHRASDYLNTLLRPIK